MVTAVCQVSYEASVSYGQRKYSQIKETKRKGRETMIFDTHAHYDDKQFDQDREELLASMKDNGIGTIVDVGSNMETSTWIVEAVTRYPMMYGAVGVHPSDTAELKESDIDTLKKYAAMDRILAIGEIGLDYYWDEPERSIQKKWFEAQIELARDVNYRSLFIAGTQQRILVI